MRDDSDREVPRWVRPGVWVGGIFAVLILYFIVYPQILFRLDDVGVFDESPGWVITTLETSLYPILRMAEAMPFYTRLTGVPI